MRIKFKSRTGAFILAIYAAAGLVGTGQATEENEPPETEKPRLITCTGNTCFYSDGSAIENVTVQSDRGKKSIETAILAFEVIELPTESSLAMYKNGTLTGVRRGPLSGPVDYGDIAEAKVDDINSIVEIKVIRDGQPYSTIEYYLQTSYEPSYIPGPTTPRQVPGSENP